MTSKLMPALLTAGTFIAGAAAVSADVLYHPTTGHALGITDFSFMGTTYDVSFLGGSYEAVYGVGAPIFLGNIANATSARTQILNILNAEADVPVISDGDSEVLWLPYELLTDNFRAVQLGHNAPTDVWTSFANFSGATDTDYSDPPFSWLFAKFGDPGSLTVPEVPVPAAGLLLVGGLGGLALMRRRKA